jgi:DNA-binding IclR family transcriptional regulator
VTRDQPPAERAKPSAESAVLQRMAEILGLFSEQSPTIGLEDVEAALGVSQATAYRYLNNLLRIGLLSRSSGRYVPGSRIMELEYIITRYDPIIVVSKELINELSRGLGCHVLLGRFYGDRFINVYSRHPDGLAGLNFAPGRRMPMFRGSQARVMLAAMDRRRLRRIFDAGAADPDRDRIGASWELFSAALQKIRRDGFYISREELDVGVIGIAAPVLDEAGGILGSLVVAYPKQSKPALSEAELVEIVKEKAREIARRIVALVQPESDGPQAAPQD